MPPAPGQWRMSGQSSSGEFWSQARPSGCRTGILLHLYALHIAGAPRSAATFNSKACQLWEARNASYGTSEEGTTRGDSCILYQVSASAVNMGEPPSLALPGTWQRFVCGLVCAFHHGGPRAQHSARRSPTHGCYVPRGSFTSGTPINLSN